ncbi:similar to Saccharomyces cerevisiae YPR174C Protein of unknown function [Maudiozyma barnettii]|uniref:Uncharacterized protein n=1 Tax=Maudiozyma barnettii TaxID=61262 RepID=A0A8H2VHK4_9SACH|nr:uncharacterized protein KABA2_07S00242 [Kazachstania barnettii]CAB4255601.1 similar to Saccharomyces cerevisiae YPR174C Protein of unknown function [Kazachstania barnettii]CAD1784161.1 similar to Saccharomyces cerevisiae YPR174C Protein of unknown function [Kazachstania barnettii]
MLGSIQELTKNFFYDSSKQNGRADVPYEPYKTRRPRNIPPKYDSIRANSRRNRIQKSTANNVIKNKKFRDNRSSMNDEMIFYKNGNMSGSLKRYSRKFSNLKDYLFSIFSNDTETLENLKESCYNITVRRKNSNINSNNSYLNIKQRIENSKAFRSKLFELKYDKEQLQNLRRSKGFNPALVLKENISPRSIDDDKIFLLKNENRLLKRDLKSTVSELEVTKKRLNFTLEKNRNYMKKINELKLQLNDYKLENARTHTKKDTLLNPPNLGKAYNKHIDRHRSESVDDNKNMMTNENIDTDNLSPVRVDFSRYSDNSNVSSR